MADQQVDTTTEVDDAENGPEGQEGAVTEGEWKAPTQEEWTRTQAALKKANDEAKTHRLKARDLAQQHEDANTKAAREAAEAASAKFKPVAVKASARSAFLEAGLADAAGVAKLIKLLDMDAIEIDDEGDITGLDDQIASVKQDFPSLFTKERAPRTPRVDAAGKPIGQAKPKTSGELHAARIMGRTA